MKWLIMLEGVGVSSGPAITLAVNVLIQSSILIGLGLLLGRLFRSRGAAFESAVLRATLMAVILCPLVALVLNLTGVHTLSIYLPQPVAGVLELFEIESAGQGVTKALAVGEGGLSEMPSEVSVVDIHDEAATLAMKSEISEVITAEQLESFDSDVPAEQYSLLGVVYGALTTAWLCISVCLAGRLLLYYARLWYIRRSAFEAESETVELWREIAEYLNVRMPRILVSPAVVSPYVAGILRSVVLLPQEGESVTMASREVILHELAHLARSDCLWIMLSKLVSAVLFFQPLVWVLGRRNQRAAEDVCDDYVVRYSSDRQSYAHQLVDIAERYLPSGCEANAAVGVVSFRSALGRRVKRIMDTGRRLSTRAGKRTVFVVAVIAVLATFVSGLIAVTNTKVDAKVEDTPEKAAASGWEDSRAWYFLRQTDTTGLLHGLPQRLGKAIVPSKRQTPMWQGVENGGTIDLEIRVEGEAPGEIFVGFFSDARWWLSSPVQVRCFPGPGRYTVDRLMPGKYCVGAMIGSLPRPDAFGVHRRWPAPIEIERARTLRVDVLVSTDFEDRVWHPDQYKGFAGQFGPMDPAQTITVRTVDHQGNPVPFCRVTYRDRDPSTRDPFHLIGTDEQGYSYCGKMDGPFSLTAARNDFVPANFAQRYQFRRFQEVHNTADRKVVTVQWPPYPTGTGKVKGRIYNQHGQALRTYYLSISQDEKGSSRSKTDHYSFGYKVPITDTDGRFEIENLPPGRYKVMVRAFDYVTHTYNFNMGQFTIAEKDNAVTEFNLEVEAKELLYGRAVYEDGSPVYPGMHIACFGEDDYFALNMEKDGSFRVCLSRQEREDLLKNRGGMVEIEGKTGEKWHELREVHIDKFSKDPNNPAEIVVPRPKVEPSSTGTRDKTEKPSRPANIDDGTSPFPFTDRPTIEPFELTDTDGHTHRLSYYEGKAVLLNIFTTWCGPCDMERPHLIKLHSEYADKGLVILAISRKEKPDVVESWVRKNRPPFPVLVDEEQQATRQFANEKGRVPVPTNILLDQQHRIVKQSSGFSEEKFAELKAAVANLIVL